MSTTLSYITMREEEGYKPAMLMKQYKTEPDRPLAAILSLNTIANTVGAAGVGQQAMIVFGSQWFGLVSAVVTLLILIFSEIIPKTLGTTYWKHLMHFTASVDYSNVPICKTYSVDYKTFPRAGRNAGKP